MKDILILLSPDALLEVGTPTLRRGYGRDSFLFPGAEFLITFDEPLILEVQPPIVWMSLKNQFDNFLGERSNEALFGNFCPCTRFFISFFFLLPKGGNPLKLVCVFGKFCFKCFFFLLLGICIQNFFSKRQTFRNIRHSFRLG